MRNHLVHEWNLRLVHIARLRLDVNVAEVTNLFCTIGHLAAFIVPLIKRSTNSSKNCIPPYALRLRYSISCLDIHLLTQRRLHTLSPKSHHLLFPKQALVFL